MVAADEFLRAAGASARASFVVQLALEELITNTFAYGYDDAGEHSVDVGVTLEADRVVLTLEDDARPFDPSAYQPAATGGISIGGRGLRMVRGMASSLRYERCGQRNRLTVTAALA